MGNRALLVGINAYSVRPLRGCVNDVKDLMQLLLDRCGFQQGEVRTLIDAEATTENIRAALEGWLVRSASPGDRLLFHFSGHGSLMPLSDKNIHNVICPHDCDFTEQKVLSDLDFRRIFSVVPQGVTFNWVSDSCHSGNLAKSLKAVLGRFFTRKKDTLPRYLPPPAHIQQEIQRLRTSRAATKSLSDGLEQLYGVLIAGCDSHEESADAWFDGRYNGALTYFLLKKLSEKGGLAKDVDSVLKEVVRAVSANGFSQNPQIRGVPALRKRPFLATGASQ